MSSIGAIILAGGKSSRMGEDKGLMSLFGKPMIAYVIDEVMKITTSIKIIANHPQYKSFGFPVYPDFFKDKGPLGGIHAGLKVSEHEKNILVSCDLPYLQHSLLKHLIFHSEGFDVTVPVQQEQIHPLIGVYQKTGLPMIEEQIKTSDLKVSNLLKKLNVNLIDTKEFDPINFKNVNSKKDIVGF
ncbi:MAG: molybdenum cofactor guanylyltransferase [Crocinitomicaceae bacterium]